MSNPIAITPYPNPLCTHAHPHIPQQGAATSFGAAQSAGVHAGSRPLGPGPLAAGPTSPYLDDPRPSVVPGLSPLASANAMAAGGGGMSSRAGQGGFQADVGLGGSPSGKAVWLRPSPEEKVSLAICISVFDHLQPLLIGVYTLSVLHLLLPVASAAYLCKTPVLH